MIAQDLAVFEMMNLPVHASTQCAIRTPEQALFYESLGATRLILERQLSLEQIKAIRDVVSCELEFFVHGALCVCYSGQCYMSEAIAGRSANRGACIQACRSLYDLEDNSGRTIVKDKALLSLKDFNLIRRLEDLAEAGISSFKIEGRLKGISYVRNVVKAYSEALDKLVAKYPDRYRRASFGKVIGGFTPDPGKTFNRGYTELFLDGERGLWSSMDAPKSVGEPIGTVSSIKRGDPRAKGLDYPKSSESMQVIVRLKDPAIQLHNGDGFSFISKDHNSIVGFRADTCRGAMINTRIVPELYEGATIFRNMDTAFEKDIEANLPKRQIPVDVSVSVSAAGSKGSYILTLKGESQDGRNVQLEECLSAQTASNTERMNSLFHSQISKSTGIYSFNLKKLEVLSRDGGLPLMSASLLNGLRRRSAEMLDSSPCRKRPLGIGKESSLPCQNKSPKTVSYKANISNSTSKDLLKKLGAESIEDAFEISHRQEAELMRSKYCIRHELGICLKDSSASGSSTGSRQALRMTKGPLYLVNNGKRYRLDFDCARCEMTVKQ